MKSKKASVMWFSPFSSRWFDIWNVGRRDANAPGHACHVWGSDEKGRPEGRRSFEDVNWHD
ncbi:MAG: hypothetical protein CMA84_04820 [Euryarchaeota archaeon]|nr:hypothetical protein [Euryarchaeota archaeon]